MVSLLYCVQLLNISTPSISAEEGVIQGRGDKWQASDDENLHKRGSSCSCYEGGQLSGLSDDRGEDNTQNHLATNFTRLFKETEDLCKVYAPCANCQTTHPELHTGAMC